jgi:hypothetical protein
MVIGVAELGLIFLLVLLSAVVAGRLIRKEQTAKASRWRDNPALPFYLAWLLVGGSVAAGWWGRFAWVARALFIVGSLVPGVVWCLVRLRK